jgi:hypothetical protein
MGKRGVQRLPLSRGCRDLMGSLERRWRHSELQLVIRLAG